MTHVLLLIGCAGVLYLACEWFVNAIEWLGAELNVGRVAVGSILAAIGTALPESVVTLFAILFGGEEQGKDLGVGAALGGPLVVGTIAYGVAGVVLLRRDKGPVRDVHLGRLAEDQKFYLMIASVLVLLGLVAFPGKRWLGLVFFAAYGFYVRREMSRDEDSAAYEGLEPLKLAPHSARPHQLAIWGQTLGSLAVIFVASQLFVHQLEWVGPAIGLPSTLVALLLSPVATELPETLNAVIWVRQGKTQLALSNVAGAMMVQSTVPAGIGLLMTPWRYDAPLLIAALATMCSIGYLLVTIVRRQLTAGRLALAAGWYAAFVVAVLVAT